MSSSRSGGSLTRTSRGMHRLWDAGVGLDQTRVWSRLDAWPVPETRPRATVWVMRNLVDLASRRAGAIEVALIWDRRQQALVVFAHDGRTREEIAIPVSADEATEVYRHPFAYAHRSVAAPDRSRSAAPL